MISRDEAVELIHKYLRNEKLIAHSLAVEAILKAMAEQLHEDVELWGLTGLLHDMDFEYTKDDPQKHTMITAEMLNGLVPQQAIDAIKAHNYEHTGQLPTTALDRALIAADAVSGLIIATALVVPSKKICDVKLETLQNKFKDNSFAARCNRKRILLCNDNGFEIDMFLDVCLTALRDIDEKLGL